MINTFVDLVGMVYEHFLKESYDLSWKNKDQEEVGEEPPRETLRPSTVCSHFP